MVGVVGSSPIAPTRLLAGDLRVPFPRRDGRRRTPVRARMPNRRARRPARGAHRVAPEVRQRRRPHAVRTDAGCPRAAPIANGYHRAVGAARSDRCIGHVSQGRRIAASCGTRVEPSFIPLRADAGIPRHCGFLWFNRDRRNRDALAVAREASALPRFRDALLPGLAACPASRSTAGAGNLARCACPPNFPS